MTEIYDDIEPHSYDEYYRENPENFRRSRQLGGMLDADGNIVLTNDISFENSTLDSYDDFIQNYRSEHRKQDAEKRQELMTKVILVGLFVSAVIVAGIIAKYATIIFSGMNM